MGKSFEKCIIAKQFLVALVLFKYLLIQIYFDTIFSFSLMNLSWIWSTETWWRGLMRDLLKGLVSLVCLVSLVSLVSLVRDLVQGFCL